MIMPSRLGGLGFWERRKLLQWGLGQAESRPKFNCVKSECETERSQPVARRPI